MAKRSSPSFDEPIETSAGTLVSVADATRVIIEAGERTIERNASVRYGAELLLKAGRTRRRADVAEARDQMMIVLKLLGLLVKERHQSGSGTGLKRLKFPGARSSASKKAKGRPRK